MNALMILKDARALLSDPAHFTTGVFARDKKGDKVDYDSDRACSFCALGAIMRCGLDAPVEERRRARLALNKALEQETSPGVSRVNDGPNGYTLILRGFDAAIARLEQES